MTRMTADQINEGTWEVTFSGERVRTGMIAEQRHTQDGDNYRMRVSLGYASLDRAHKIIELMGFKDVKPIKAKRVFDTHDEAESVIATSPDIPDTWTF